MSIYNNSESQTESPSENHERSGDADEQSQQSSQVDDASSDDGTPPLEMNQCPECGARRFVSKLLVYEETSFDESGEREFRRQNVRAEFEYSCTECQTPLRRLPADRHDYYEEVSVLDAQRRAALEDQIRELSRQVGQRLWALKLWGALVVLAVVVVVAIRWL
jgi:DNA-directed RNA polymerase subunit RPC12/RpoP